MTAGTIHSATILQVIPRLETGGAEMATVEITGALAQAGARAIVFSEGGRMAPEIEAAGGIFVPFPAATKNPFRMLVNGSAIARFIRERGVDLVHARSRAPAWSALLAARRTGIPFVTTYHGAYGTRGPFKNSYNSVMARGDIVIANSRYTADLVRARHGTPEGRLRIIHRGVDLVRFDPDAVEPERVEALRARWGVDVGQKLVLQSARLSDWKGQRYVIDAAARLRAEHGLDDVVFILAGDAQGREGYVARLEDRIHEHGLGGVVKLVGHCSDMAAAYKAAHVTVVASTEAEAFGRASAEAGATGCPVIVTDLGATSEHLLLADRDGQDKATGWLVPPADADALADALRVALRLPDDARAEMGLRAHAHIAANFSAERMAFATLKVYDTLLHSALAGAYTQVRDA